MFKFLGCISKLFLYILLWLAIGVFSTFVIPFITAGRYEANETPDRYFIVLVEINDSENNQTGVQAVSWNEYFDKINDYKAYLSTSEGNCDNSPLWCRAKNIDSGKQLIELRDRQEDFWLYNKYYVSDHPSFSKASRQVRLLSSQYIATFGYCIFRRIICDFQSQTTAPTSRIFMLKKRAVQAWLG